MKPARVFSPTRAPSAAGKPRGRSVGIALAMAIALPAQASLIFDGLFVPNPGAPHVRSQYSYESSASIVGTTVNDGSITPSPWPEFTLHSGESITATANGVPSGRTSSSLALAIGAAGEATPATVHKLHIELAGTNTSGGFNAALGALHFRFSGSAPVVYWGAEWTISVLQHDEPPGASDHWWSWGFRRSDPSGTTDVLTTQSYLPFSLAEGDVITGSLFGSSPANGLQGIGFTTAMGYYPDTATRVAFDFTFAFSGSPFDDIPDPSHSVPDSAPTSLLLGAALAALRMRTRARPARP